MNADAVLAVTVAPVTVKTETGMGGVKTSVKVSSTTVKVNRASETETSDTVMTESSAVIDCVLIVNMILTDVEFGDELEDELKNNSAERFAERLLIDTMTEITIAVELIMAVKENDSCTETGA